MIDDQIIQNRKLTEMQQRFVDCFTSGGEAGADPKAAALAAGYSADNAVEIARQLLAKPHVIAAIDAALREAIGTRLTVQAVNVIESIIRNPDASLKLRGEMACKVIEYSGIIDRTKAEKAKAVNLGGRSLSEMTREELEMIVLRGAEALRVHDDPANSKALAN